jgi:Holliday junction resolvase RusA-like endonuclease
MYDPNRDNKDIVAWYARKVYKGKPLEQALRVKLDFYFKPSRVLADVMEAEIKNETLPYTKVPDVDNLVKLVLDALNHVIWLDDSYVVQIEAAKWYSLHPRTEINIREAQA